MKKNILRFVLSLGAVGIAPSVMLSQIGGDVPISAVCLNPDYADLRDQLWAYVTEADRTEIYIAYLEICGSSPLSAETAALARQIVISRTASFSDMPDDIYSIVFADNTPTGYTAVYVS